MRKVLILTIVICFSAFSILTKQKVSAQTPASSFAISPPSFDFTANPGDVIKNSIRVENLSDLPLNITAKPENFLAYGDTGQVSLTEEDTSYAINKWINLPVNVATISPKESETFEFIITIPQNTEPGSHYGAIVFSTITSGTTDGTGASVQQEIGSLILIKVPGDVIEDAKVDSFVSQENVYTDSNLMFKAVIENTGTLHFKPVGRIYIKDIFGNIVETIEVDSKNILPKNKRAFEENFTFERVGYYKAEIEMFYKNGEKVLRDETSFVALNLSKSVPVLIIVSGVVALYFFKRKRINKAIMVIVKG
jgi:hypothetical protein